MSSGGKFVYKDKCISQLLQASLRTSATSYSRYSWHYLARERNIEQELQSKEVNNLIFEQLLPSVPALQQHCMQLISVSAHGRSFIQGASLQKVVESCQQGGCPTHQVPHQSNLEPITFAEGVLCVQET